MTLTLQRPKPDAYAPGQAPLTVRLRRLEDVQWADSLLEEAYESPSKRREVSERVAFAAWLVGRRIVSDEVPG